MIRNINNKYILAITPVILLLSLLLKIPIYIGIAVCLIITFTVSNLKGYKKRELFQMMKDGVLKVKFVLIMLFFIGILISTWMKIGTLPSMIYYGIKLLSNTNILLAAFISCSIMSMIIGTGIGTVSTMGIVYMGIANGLNIPLAPVVGAVVAGAYLGDRTSPMSSNLNLIVNVTDVPLHSFLKTLFKTSIPTFILSLLFYWIVGSRYMVNSNGYNDLMYLRELLINNSSINILCLLPPLLIIIEIAIFRWSIVKSIIVSLIVSIIIGFYLTPSEMSDIFSIIVYGYHPLNIEIASIMSGGGVVSMLAVLTVIVLSTSLCGIYDGTNMLEPILENVSKRIKNKFDLFLYTGLTSLIISIVTFNQTLASIIPGKYLRKKCDEIGADREYFALSISDVGMITVPIIPWNVNAILVVTITHVSALDYLPFAVFCWGLPIVSIVMAFLRNKKEIKASI